MRQLAQSIRRGDRVRVAGTDFVVGTTKLIVTADGAVVEMSPYDPSSHQFTVPATHRVRVIGREMLPESYHPAHSVMG